MGVVGNRTIAFLHTIVGDAMKVMGIQAGDQMVVTIALDGSEARIVADALAAAGSFSQEIARQIRLTLEMGKDREDVR
jgi:hypothetical protein